MVDVPTMPVPIRLEVTSIGGRTTPLFLVLSCPFAGEATHAPGPALHDEAEFTSHNKRSFVCVRASANASVKTKSDAKDAREGPTVDLMCGMSWEISSHGLRTGIAVTAAKDRSVWTPRPPVG